MKHPTPAQQRALAALWTKKLTKSYLQRQAENVFDGAVRGGVFWFSLKLLKLLPAAKPWILSLMKLL